MKTMLFLIAALVLLIAPPAHGQYNEEVDSVYLTLASKTGVDRWNYLVDQALIMKEHFH